MSASRVLLLGGMDPSGGAGLTLDAAVVAAHGGLGLPVAVVLTAQNRDGFRDAFPVAAAQWGAALAAALDDGEIGAVKTGLLGSAATVAAVAAALQPLAGRLPIVVDPVLAATAGGLDADAAVVAALRELLLPLATVVTPNGPEFAALAPIAAATLQTGGHAVGANAEDVLTMMGATQRFARPRLDVGAVRGTGCALASSIAFRLARGDELAVACRGAGDWLHEVLSRLGVAAGDRPRTLPLGWPT